MRAYRHLDVITAFYVAVLLISNIASTKIVNFGTLSFGSFSFNMAFDGGTILFPLAYIFGDILTEVYGYGRSRRVIWLGFGAAILLSLVLSIVSWLPAALEWGANQAAFETILGQTPRIVLASILAYLNGEFINSFILAKMKVLTEGKYLWMRTIGSTIAGEGFDTMIFCMIAFYGVLPNELLLTVIISNYIFKVGVEVLATPITYAIVGFLKRSEKEDFYDTNTNFSPLKFEA